MALRESGLVQTIGLALSICVLAACAADTGEPTSATTDASPTPTEAGKAQEAAVSTAVATYREAHRPQVHFSPPTSWMNDPNGLVHFDGEYHLFYQYYPDDTVWGPMHWGHAISRDLVHWEHLPIALTPDEKGYIFSGSAVIDWHNTSGFGDGSTPPMVAIFTYHDAERGRHGSTDHESQGIAYSLDRGRSWTKYADNPVLPNPGDRKDFRDPKVFWHAPTARWVMALSVTDHVRLYASSNLKDWQYLSSFGAEFGAHDGVWECPDLFPIRVEGSDETRWALLLNLNPGGPQGGSGTQYFVGDFDGTRFALDPAFAGTLQKQEAVWLDWGRDNYAGVTWSDVPEEDGRRLFIGWMGNWDYAQKVPTSPWRSAMTLPRTLTLHRHGDDLRLHARPVRELGSLRGKAEAIAAMRVDASMSMPVAKAGTLPREVELTFDLGEERAGSFGIALRNTGDQVYRIGFDRDAHEFFSDRRRAGSHAFSETFAPGQHRAPRDADGTTLHLRLILDVASVELFADDGRLVMTETFFPDEPFDQIELFAEAAPVQVVGGTHWPLRAIWERPASADSESE